MRYVAKKSIDDPQFGNMKLAKILCWSDFLMYAWHGESITGAVYRKYEHGPAPEALWDAEDDLTKSGEGVMIEVQREPGKVQKRLVSIGTPRLEIFDGRAIAIVDWVIEQLRNEDSGRVSKMSHERLVGWIVAREGEEIPYSTILISPDPATDEDVRRGQELAKERGWVTAA